MNLTGATVVDTASTMTTTLCPPSAVTVIYTTGEPPDTGLAGVREPRRPLPAPPSDHVTVD